MNWHHPHAVGRRALVGRWLVIVVFAVLVATFFRVQVLAQSGYRLQSEENRLRPVRMPAPRGLIVDRNGVVLADNVPGYSVAVIASSAQVLRRRLTQITSIIDRDSAAIEAIVDRFQRRPHEPALIERDAPFELISALEERRAVIPGLVIQTEPKRRYPYGEIAAHVLGYVGEISESELASDAIPGVHAGSFVGKDGLERQYDEVLRGEGGVRFIEVDALGRTVGEAAEESILEPRQGDTLRTSLDIELQRYIAEEFPVGKRGAIVALDPRNGEVLALYSAPSFDPNAFVGGMDPEEWERISRSPDQPLFNRAVEGLYPPASPWKLAVAVSALRRGVVGLNSHMETPCTGGLLYGNRYFRCWKESGHGDISLREAIEFSCDVYFYQLGLHLGLRNLLSDAASLGFRESSGIDLPDERVPIFPASTDYYNQRYGPRGWTSAVTLNLAIGQGENSQSVSNMARFYAMLANPDGTAPEPHLLRGATTRRRSLGLDPEELAGLREALLEVVQTGTAAGARIEALRIAGKTGTAQNSHGPDHGWFIGFAPADAPEIVVAAVVEFAEHGSNVAPLVNRIIARHLLGPTAPPVTTSDLDIVLPADSAPEPRPLLPARPPGER